VLVPAAVHVGDLLEVAVVSIGAAFVVTLLFSLVVLASGKSMEARREGAGSASLGYIALAVLCFLTFAAVVVVGVNIMLSKG
jgi:hypothetical protein